MAESVRPQVFGVAEINHYLREYVSEDGFLSSVAVRGEIVGYKEHSSGHIYFTLREGDCSLKTVMFRRFAAHLPWQPRSGDQVVAVGRIALYERDAACQLYAELLLPDGQGGQAQYLEELKRRLEAEGLFAAERKRQLPPYALDIGVVTAADSAAWADIQRISRNRCPAARLTLYPALVQGDRAAESLVLALAEADAGGHDVIICGRGGGAGEDLAVFNSEAVVRTVACTLTPIVVAVGHESDVSLADLAADVRAATPTHAATLAVPDAAGLLQYLDDAEHQLRSALRLRMNAAAEHLDRCERQCSVEMTRHRLNNYRQRLDLLDERCHRSYAAAVNEREEDWRRRLIRLRGLDPLATLERGFALAYTDSGTLLRSAGQLQVGERFSLRLSQGSITALVDEIGAADIKNGESRKTSGRMNNGQSKE